MKFAEAATGARRVRPFLGRIKVVLPAVALAIGAATCAAARPIDDALALAVKLEAMEAGDSSKGVVRSPQSALADAERGMAEQLRQTPDDVPALLVAARLARLRSVLQPLTLRFGPGTPPREQVERQLAPRTEALDQAQALLDRALALQDGNAAAHFWKARVLAEARPAYKDGKPTMSSDFAGAEKALRRALELAPGEPTYREHLVMNLMGSQKIDDAAAAAASLGEGRHPLAALIRDLKALPLPDNAVPWPPEARTLVQAGMAPQPWAAGRVLATLVPGPAKEVEAFYARAWPGFRLLQIESMADPNLNYQWLQLAEGKVRFAASAAELPKQPKDGIMMSVFETDRLGLMDDPASFPIGAGSRYSRLWFINLRPVSRSP